MIKKRFSYLGKALWKHKKQLSHLGTILFSVLLLGISLWAISREIETYSLRDVANSLRSLPKYRLGLALLLTAIGYWVTTLYDVLALRYIRRSLPYRQAAFAAFTSFAFSNSVGFPLLTSSAIRYRLYLGWGLSIFEITQLIAFGNLSFWLGILTVGGVLFVREPLPVPKLLNWSFASVEMLGIIFLALVSAYLLLSIFGARSLKISKWELLLPSPQFSIAQIVLSAVDWGFAVGVLYALVVTPEPLSYFNFFAIYLLALLAGWISNVPGGLGVFETVFILLLPPTIAPDAALGSLLVYRGIYYFLPFGVAVVMLWLREMLHRSTS